MRKTSSVSSSNPAREQRLKAALRDNLRRRKDAAKPRETATMTDQAPFKIGFVLFPMLTQLDFTGPLQVLHRLPGSQVHIVAASLDPVPTDCGLSLVPTGTFANAPDFDLICVPGGFGVDQAMQDAALVAFVRRQGLQARYVTSVCTGAFILGAAGLLDGKKATTHWAYHERLARFGAVPTQGRVVRDGNLFTGGGVTAGIDFALTVAAEVANEAVARTIQLSIEYDPSPPFQSGHPAIAQTETLARMQAMFDKRLPDFDAAVDAALAHALPA